MHEESAHRALSKEAARRPGPDHFHLLSPRIAARAWLLSKARTERCFSRPTIYINETSWTPTHTLMAIELIPFTLPASADAAFFADFGREVKGVDPGNFTPEQFKEIEQALYQVSAYWVTAILPTDRRAA